MKIETLKERLAKAEAKIAKKNTTIANKTLQISKKYALLEKIGVEDPRSKGKYDFSEIRESDVETWTKIYWTYCDIENLNADITRGEHEIEETKKTIAKYQDQLAGEIARESLFATEVPEILKNMESELVDTWDAWDKTRRDNLRAEYKEIGYREFSKKRTGADYEFMYKTNDEIHNANVNDARLMVLDLYNRVKGITGEVTDWTGIEATIGTYGFSVLNGIVIGKEGRARVESILAGGYNIQRLHVRVLVHEI